MKQDVLGLQFDNVTMDGNGCAFIGKNNQP